MLATSKNALPVTFGMNVTVMPSTDFTSEPAAEAEPEAGVLALAGAEEEVGVPPQATSVRAIARASTIASAFFMI